MKTFAWVALATGLTNSALAQSGTATWQVSTDGGATWASDATLNAPQAVKVRLRMGWENIPNAICFAGSQFDAFILTASAGDTVSDIARPPGFNFFPQTLGATRYSQGIKLDSTFDSAPPGVGSGWIAPGQNTPNAVTPDTSNPATVFTYTLNLDATSGTRTIRNIFAGATGRALKVYINPFGAQAQISSGQVTINTATITVIPAPSTAAFITLSCFGIRRRR